MSCLNFGVGTKTDSTQHQKKSGIRADWYREFFAELFGTFFIVVSIEVLLYFKVVLQLVNDS